MKKCLAIYVKSNKRRIIMPTCKERAKMLGFCDGNLSKTDWLPRSGEDPVLREYKCQSCGVLAYLKTGRLQKVKGQAEDGASQPVLL